MRKHAHNRLAALSIAVLLALLGASATAQTRTQLKVYSTLEPENIAEFKRAFESDNPDVDIVWLRDSTGVLTARILAEGERQHGDAIWGLAVTSVAKFRSWDCLSRMRRQT